MIGSLLAKFLALIGLTRNLAWFDKRMVLEDLKIIPIPPGKKLKVSEQYYKIDAPLADVYEAYINARPEDMWPEEWILFHFLIAPNSKERLSSDNFPTPIQVGSRAFVELLCRPMHRWLKLMVAVEVTELKKNETLRYDYMEGCVTKGWNIIHFREEHDSSGNPQTLIHHRSEYLGTSTLIRMSMPFFQKKLHVGFVDALHGGMTKLIYEKRSSNQ